MTGLHGQRPVQPGSAAGGYPLAPWLILTGFAGGGALLWLAWLAGRVAIVLSGDDWVGPGFGWEFTGDLFHRRWERLWPGVPPVRVGVVFVLLLAAVVVPVGWGWVWWQARRPRADDPLPSLADARDLGELTGAAAVRRAQRLRPGLAGLAADAVPPTAVGVALGRLVTRHRRQRPVLRSSWEDVLLAIMAPRAGKTTALAVPPVLDAPGAVLATSNRSDVWATTNRARARVGTVWLFDPQNITRQPQRLWWDPLAGISGAEEAGRLADHFIQEIRGTGSSDPFWPLAAGDLLTCLFLAAAGTGGTLADVQAWLTDVANREPVTLLRAAGYPQAARSLAGRQAGAPETRDGVYETARTAARCLADPDIMAWVTPSPGLPALQAAALPASRDTLYLLSKEGSGAAAPLVAALTDTVFRAGVARAEAAGGRIDPPLLAVLDEAANICKISDLPQLYSHLGGRAIIPITIIQNLAQGQGVWGERGMAALWSAATIKLIGAGLDDARHADDISRLIGDHDVATTSVSRDGNGHRSYSTSPHRRRILEPGDLRSLPRGRAILLATGARAAMIELMPWYAGPHADTITADTAASVDAITRNARATFDGDIFGGTA
ncbi:TraM recognition domain-containing protein [Solwaraspora sp. WMMD1047]|uniref:type IV secretory system conjugative DNA transfer family protein n=1 Tax=Solwaraspora sp. WMMD1047 TaxID=3016102 RepID=UPI0024176745|nr:type IV secretory system conjugative DNA transfer family protein [Solwaraspora sp. WMMD1047]MDG4833031.1 TraM recognition domain-containing protein [Solwaraspora sp. WMMD1047]